jgi:hypothetical protein
VANCQHAESYKVVCYSLLAQHANRAVIACCTSLHTCSLNLAASIFLALTKSKTWLQALNIIRVTGRQVQLATIQH